MRARLARGQAVVRLATLSGQPADLSRLSKLVVPAGVDIEIVDLGWRCNVIVTADDRQVTVIGDLDSGRRLISSAASELTDLVDLASEVLRRMRATRDSNYSAEEVGSTLDDIAVFTPGSFLLGSAKW